MYDFVLQFCFDESTQTAVQELRSHIRVKGLVDRQRGWLPHITIDMYNAKNHEEFFRLVEEVISGIGEFELNLDSLENFQDGTLYIAPREREKLREIKLLFDEKLDGFRLNNRRAREYNPHVTLCTNDCVEESRAAAMERFVPMRARVKYIKVYTEKMELVADFALSGKAQQKTNH